MRVALGGSALVVRRERGVRVALEAHPSKRRARVHPVARRLDGEREGIVGGGERRGRRRRRRRRGPASARARRRRRRVRRRRVRRGGAERRRRDRRVPRRARPRLRAERKPRGRAERAVGVRARVPHPRPSPRAPRLDEARGRGVCAPREGGARAKETKSNLVHCSSDAGARRGGAFVAGRFGLDSTRLDSETDSRFRFAFERANLTGRVNRPRFRRFAFDRANLVRFDTEARRF